MSDRWKEDGAERKLHQENQELKAELAAQKTLVLQMNAVNTGLHRENIALKSAGKGLYSALKGVITGALAPHCFSDSREIIDNYIRAWLEVCGE